MPHINAFIRDEDWDTYMGLKLTGLWPQFLHDCLVTYREEFKFPNMLTLEQRWKQTLNNHSQK